MGVFYHHFGTTDDLVPACFQRAIDIIRQTIPTAEAFCSNGVTNASNVRGRADLAASVRARLLL